MIDDALAALSTSEPEREDPLGTLADALEDLGLRDGAAYLEQLSSQVRVIVESDSASPPDRVAWDLLKERIPDIRRFTNADRGLRSRYSFDEVNFPDQALANLLALANLDIDQIVSSIDAENYGTVATLQERANARLAQELERWTQATISVRLH